MIEHPRLQEVAAERAEIEIRIAVLRSVAADAHEQHQTALSKWRPTADEALAQGRRPPPEPEPPDLSEVDAELYRLRLALERLVARRQAVLVEIGPEVEAEALAGLAALSEEARPLLERLAEIAGQATPMLRAVREVRGAADTLAGRRLESRVDQRSHPLPVTVEALIRHVRGEIDLLGVAALSARPATEPHRDRSETPEVRIGLSPPDAFGRRPAGLPRRARGRDRFT